MFAQYLLQTRGDYIYALAMSNYQRRSAQVTRREGLRPNLVGICIYIRRRRVPLTELCGVWIPTQKPEPDLKTVDIDPDSPASL